MKLKYIIIPVVLLLAGAGCEKATPTQPSAQAQQQQAPQPAEELVYKNAEYGFSLTFPQTWKDYTATQRNIDWGGSVSSPSIDFTVPGDESLFNIAVLTKAQWQKLQNDPDAGPMLANVIGENTKHVFLSAGSQDASQKNLPRRAEVSDILKTFTLQK